MDRTVSGTLEIPKYHVGVMSRNVSQAQETVPLPMQTAHFPPCPPQIFRVGITGHRPNRLNPDTAALAAKLSLVLAEMKAEVLAGGGASVPELRIVSSLAEGVDRIAAWCALELGYKLDAPLPLPRDEYAADFDSQSSLDEYRALLSRADRVFELEAAPQHRDFAYRAAGHIVLRHCDLLLAVWDGQPSRGVGGTSELINVAEETGHPVLCMDANAPHEISFLNATDAMGTVRSLISNQPCLDTPQRHAPAQEATERYRAEPWPKRVATTSHTVLRLLGERRWSHARVPDRTSAPQLTSPVLDRYFRWVDGLAIFYGERSRSAAMRMQLLALGAVLSAILILPFEEHRGLLQFFSMCELLCILWLMIEAVRSRRSDWHARWIVYRSLSERLRCLDFLAPLAESVPAPFTSGFVERDRSSHAFGNAFVQGASREYGLPTAVVNDEFLKTRAQSLEAVLRSQAAFQHSVAQRYESVERTLQRCGIGLFVVAIVLCSIDVLRAITPGFFEGLSGFGISGVRIATAAAIVPALGAAIAGLAAQGEYKRLAIRADAMSKTLTGMLLDLQGNRMPTLRMLQSLAGRMAEVLTSEVQDWQVLVAAKPPQLPT